MNSQERFGWSMLSWTRAKRSEAPGFPVRKSILILVLALLGLGLAGCGGGDENVPDGAVAVVDGEQISKSDFDALMARAKT
jgi:hypothetical protein